MNETDEQRTRELLHDAVADVEPAHGLAAIRARTATSRRARWGWPAVAAAAGIALLVGAMSVLTDRDGGSTSHSPAGRPSAAAQQTPSPPTASASEPPAAGPAVAVPVYYVADTSRGPRLFREFHRVTSDDPLLAAARLAVAGSPDDPDYRTLWPQGTRVAGVSFDGVGDAGSAQVRLDGAGLEGLPSGMSDRDAKLALQQLIWTVNGVLQASPGYDWYLGRHHARKILGQELSHGSGALSASDVLAQVQVDDPVDGSTVGSTFTVRGRAAAFEATVLWELVKGGVVVRRGSAMAHECCTLSPYSFRLRDVPPGDYVLVVHDEDVSGGEGFPPWRDTKRITVE